MKKVIFVLAFCCAFASTASAFEVVTGKGTINAIVLDGKTYAININTICGKDTMRAGKASYDVGRDGQHVTIGGKISRIICVPNSGGGGSNQAYEDEWKDSPLVDDGGNVTMNPGETGTDHPSTDPTDSGFEGEGPPSIDG